MDELMTILRKIDLITLEIDGRNLSSFVENFTKFKNSQNL